HSAAQPAFPRRMEALRSRGPKESRAAQFDAAPSMEAKRRTAQKAGRLPESQSGARSPLHCQAGHGPPADAKIPQCQKGQPAYPRPAQADRSVRRQPPQVPRRYPDQLARARRPHVALFQEQWNHRGLSHKDGDDLAPRVRLPQLSQLPLARARSLRLEWRHQSGLIHPHPPFTGKSPAAKWRSGRDSNPRYGFAVYSLSRRAPSTTRPPLRMPWMRAGPSRLLGLSQADWAWQTEPMKQLLAAAATAFALYSAAHAQVARPPLSPGQIEVVPEIWTGC